jgi:hypothetical protein
MDGVFRRRGVGMECAAEVREAKSRINWYINKGAEGRNVVAFQEKRCGLEMCSYPFLQLYEGLIVTTSPELDSMDQRPRGG